MEYLAQDVRILNFVNADLVASGLSPLRPELAAVAAARWVLREIDRLVANQLDFAFESTLSGVGYVNRLQRMRTAGYHIEIIYLQVSTTALALKRIAARVRQGGHHVPRADVLRRFTRSRKNFENI
jgi:predicted ABC-type ATPase